MEEKINKILIPYTVEYQIGPMEEPYKGIQYFDLTQYYKYKHQNEKKQHVIVLFFYPKYLLIDSPLILGNTNKPTVPGPQCAHTLIAIGKTLTL